MSELTDRLEYLIANSDVYNMESIRKAVQELKRQRTEIERLTETEKAATRSADEYAMEVGRLRGERDRQAYENERLTANNKHLLIVDQEREAVIASLRQELLEAKNYGRSVSLALGTRGGQLLDAQKELDALREIVYIEPYNTVLLRCVDKRTEFTKFNQSHVK